MNYTDIDIVIDQENRILKRQHNNLVNQVRQNEQKLLRIQQQEIRFISSNSLLDLIYQILENYRLEAGLDNVTLSLIDPEYELQRILQETGVNLADYPSLLFYHTEQQLKEFLGQSLAPSLGAYKAKTHQFFFPSNPEQKGSVALLPLIRQNNLIGSLNLGSSNRERFLPHTATDFLQRLAAIVSICLENTVNHERLKRVGLTDTLTGISNRRFFDQRIEEEISRSTRTSSPLTCLLLDIDFFKRINDTYGHQTGDCVLADVANTIQSQLRESDVLARYGGEEFSVLLIDTDTKDALEIAERIRECVASYRHQLDDQEQEQFEVTISIGMATLDESKHHYDSKSSSHLLIKNADQALYQAKENGRNQTRLFECMPACTD
jgi:diguanylate cyclase (GGDEF)-like protein